jgi:hypothetical protein
VQVAFDEPLPKPAKGGFIRHGFVRVELHELLKAQPVLELFFGLGIAQAIKMLQDHHAQQHADAARGATPVAAGGRNAFFGGSEIHFAGDGFQNPVGAAALLHGQVEKGGLVLAFGLHDASDPFTTSLVQKQKNFCRDFQRGCVEM